MALPSLLPNFVPSELVMSGVPIACTLHALGPVDEVGAAREVAPLVAAAGLQHAAVLAVELEEVEALQDLVAELGVADAGVGVEARRDRILLEHRADAVVLADVAQEVDRAESGAVQSRLLTRRTAFVALGREEATDLRPGGSRPTRRRSPWC